MRIISGKYKGRHIEARKGFKARPTTDFARENLFNVLNNHFNLEETDVLDLFAGTGSISFEFASRGCKQVDLVELDFMSLQFIKTVIAKLGIENIRACRSDAFRFLQQLKKQYDIVFADPPYTLGGIEKLPGLVFENNILLPGGWFVLEHSRQYDFRGYDHFREIRTYGSVHFSVFQDSRNR